MSHESLSPKDMELHTSTPEQRLISLANSFDVTETMGMADTRREAQATKNPDEVHRLIMLYQEEGLRKIEGLHMQDPTIITKEVGQLLLRATAYLSANLPKEALLALRDAFRYAVAMGFNEQAVGIEDEIIELENKMKSLRITLPLPEDY